MEDVRNIVIRAKNDDRKAFAELYSLYYVELYKYALYMLKNQENAKEAVSETVCDAYRDIKKLKSADSFKPWIFKILSRKIMEFYASDVPSDNIAVTYWDDTESLILKVDLQSALLKLNKTDRAIVILSACHGYNSREISEILGINRKTVRSKNARALKKLRKYIKE